MNLTRAIRLLVDRDGQSSDVETGTLLGRRPALTRIYCSESIYESFRLGLNRFISMYSPLPYLVAVVPRILKFEHLEYALLVSNCVRRHASPIRRFDSDREGHGYRGPFWLHQSIRSAIESHDVRAGQVSTRRPWRRYAPQLTD